jgi:predicted metalloendopeptidase
MRIALLALLLSSLISGLCGAQTSDTLKFDIQAVDSSADACADFYQYACGSWLKKNPIPADRSYSAVYQQMREMNQKRVSEILEQVAVAPTTNEERKIGDYYASCMDEKTIEAKGLAPLQTELSRIDAIKNLNVLAHEVARLHGFGADALFSLYADQRLEDATQVIAYLDQSGLNLPEPGYYTSSEPEMVKTREQYRAHLENEFGLLAEGGQEAKAAADDVMKIETALAKAELTPLQRRDRKAWYHLMTFAELEKLAPEFPWKTYFAAIRFQPDREMNVAVSEYVQTINQLLKTTSIEAWKNYFRWELVRVVTPALPQRFRDAEFDFYQRAMAAPSRPPSSVRI